jgi:hypothetical protein
MTKDIDEVVDASCAADFLNHYLLREFLRGYIFLRSSGGERLSQWMGLGAFNCDDVARTVASWGCWFGYYTHCTQMADLLKRCEERLDIWRGFLNANSDSIPEDVWATKSSPGEPLHEIGNLLRVLGKKTGPALFVVIDQYEVLPELNLRYGTTLQRVVNTLIKARDPVVFFKIGARTYDWGIELRILGSESRIEVQRDYTITNLADVLMREEDPKSWLFPEFARDVAYKRVRVEGHYRQLPGTNLLQQLFGRWSHHAEAALYFRKPERRVVVLRGLPPAVQQRIVDLCGSDASPLDLRLAAAWALEHLQAGQSQEWVSEHLADRPWVQRTWWRKERIEVALLQVASLANQKRRYFGEGTIMFLAGGNISAFLLLCSELWDVAAKLGLRPLQETLPPQVQAEGVYAASGKWRERDRNEYVGGRHRYEVLSRLGPAIHEAVVGDLAISNPGHSGFSLREDEMSRDERAKKVRAFLESAVSWTIFEERAHTPKSREGGTRRKWYLHPLLSPVFGIPFKRVKEPLYAKLDDVFLWIYGHEQYRFSGTRRPHATKQIALPFEGPR